VGESPPLGLDRDRVEIAAYDARWPREFADEAARLGELLGSAAVSIEHVGSTAVPGLDAKPVLDIAIAYANTEGLVAIRTALAAAGYEDRGDQGDAGGVVFVKGPASWRTHHLHLVAVESPQWRHYLAFRDALRFDESLRRDYATLKLELAARFPTNRSAYTDGKDAFVGCVLGTRPAPDAEKSQTIHRAGTDVSHDAR
jgi:GrpB-like predicted nucleotidyltransferase (UPF0157 family)